MPLKLILNLNLYHLRHFGFEESEAKFVNEFSKEIKQI